MLLVDDDQAEVVAPARRRPSAGRPPPAPRRGAAAVHSSKRSPSREPGVQQRHRVPEARREARDGLRRQRDLRHQHDHAAPRRQRPLGRPQVDLGLPRPGHPVQQVRACCASEAISSPRTACCSAVSATGAVVVRGQRQRRAAADPLLHPHQPLAPRGAAGRRGRRPPTPGSRASTSAWRAVDVPLPHATPPVLDPRPALRRKHERQRPRRRRAVLRGHPQRAVDELGGHGLRPHRGHGDELVLGLDLGRRRQRGHDPVERLAPERDAHDRADLDRARGRPVVERPGHLAGRRAAARPGRSRPPTVLASPDVILEGDNLELMRAQPDAIAQLIYTDPPFNTGRTQARAAPADVSRTPTATAPASAAAATAARASTRPPSSDTYDDYLASFLGPRLRRDAPPARPDRHALPPPRLPRGALRQGRSSTACSAASSFLNEIIWAYDYGAKAAQPLARQARHDPRLRQGPRPLLLRLRGGRSRALHGARPRHRREGRPRQAARPTSGGTRSSPPPAREKTGYPTQKPEGDRPPHGAGLHAAGRPVPRPLRRLRHPRRRRRRRSAAATC